MSLTPRLDRLEKNYIINGGLDFWQRHNNFSSGSELSAGSYQSVDRFRIATFNTSGTRASQQQGADKPNNKTPFSGLISFTSTGTASLDIQQRIESVFARDLIDGKVSFNFWYKTDEFQQVRIRFAKATAQDNFTSTTSMYDQTFSITADNTWRQFTLEGVDIHADAHTGIALIVTALTPLNGSGARTFRYSQLMLNIGDSASDFNRSGRDYHDELILCQRYFEKSYDLVTPLQTVTGAGGTNYLSSSGSFEIDKEIRYAVRKRTQATATTYSTTTGASGVAAVGAAGDVSSGAGLLSDGGFAVNGAGNAANQQVNFQWAAEAEL